MHSHIQKKHNLNANDIKNIDFIYKEISARMIERLDYIKINPENILDIGSGLEIDSKSLGSRFPKSIIFELDFAINILRNSSPKKGLFKKLFNGNSRQICADALHLPINSNSINLVWSNMCLPFISDLDAYFKEVRRVLAIGGLFLTTGLGVDSLQQLRDVGLNTFNFPDMHIIGDILVKLGFTHPVTDLEYITLEYDDINQLLSDVRVIGSGNAIINKRTSLTRKDYLDLKVRFDKLTKNGKIPLTLEVFYAHAWKDNVNIDLPDDKKIIQFHPHKK